MSSMGFDVTAIITAAVTLICVIITAVVSVHNINKESYNKRVTEERIKWLNKVRMDYSIIMATIELNCREEMKSCHMNMETYDNRIYMAEMAKYDLISRLNTSKFSGNEYNYILKDILTNTCFAEGNIDFLKQNKDDFIKYMNLMLEREWDKSKKEI